MPNVLITLIVAEFSALPLRGAYFPDHALEKVDLNPISILENWADDSGFQFPVPEGTEIEIDLESPFPEFPAVDLSESTLTFSNGDIFTVNITASVGAFGSRYPRNHPQLYREDKRPGRREESSVEINIEFKSEFGAPDVQDPNLPEHQEFAENIQTILQRDWDVDTHLRRRREQIGF